MSADDRTDAELIGSTATFAVLFDRHAVAVHRYLARRIGTSTADDLLAQTFLVAFEARLRYDRGRPDALPWLYGIATNLLRKHRRDEVRQYDARARSAVDPTVTTIDEGHSQRVAERVDADAMSPRLAAALAELNQPDRDAMLLFAWAELPYADIAAALEVPIGTVRSRLNRARGVLRRSLADLEDHQ